MIFQMTNFRKNKPTTFVHLSSFYYSAIDRNSLNYCRQPYHTNNKYFQHYLPKGSFRLALYPTGFLQQIESSLNEPLGCFSTNYQERKKLIVMVILTQRRSRKSFSILIIFHYSSMTLTVNCNEFVIVGM